MPIVEFDTNLTDEGKAVLSEAKRFFREVWRPTAVELDKLVSTCTLELAMMLDFPATRTGW